MNGVNMEGLLLQAEMAKGEKSKSPKRKNVHFNADVCPMCNERGYLFYDVQEGAMVCQDCGYVLPDMVFNENGNGIRNAKPNGNGYHMVYRTTIVHNKNNKFHIRQYVQNLYALIYPLKETDENIMTDIQKNVIQLSKKKKDGLQGMNMYVIVGIFMECAFIKNKVPVIRPKLIEFITKANNSDPKRKSKTLDYIHKKYNEYRGMKEIRSIINDCIDHQPTVKELMKYLMNVSNFSNEAREKVSKLVALLSPKNNNNNNNRPNIIANKSNNELAAFILLVVASHQNILPPDAHKAKRVYGVSMGVITNMYKGLLQMKAPFPLKPVSELFKSKKQSPKKSSPPKAATPNKKSTPPKASPPKAATPKKKASPQKMNNIKNFIIQIGDKKRKCTTYPKPEIRNEAIARGISKDIVNDKSQTKESLCALLKKHQLAGA